MAPATVNPTTPNEIQYTIRNSTAFIANFTLDVAPGAQESFSFTHPDPQAGAAYSLVYISPGGTRTTIPLPAGGAVANFAVAGDQGAPSGGSSVLAVNVTEMNGTGPNPGELWELRVNADATGQYTFDAPSTNMEVHWLAVDPVADLVVPANVFEKEEVTLNAANADPAGTVAGVLPAAIAPTYTWTHTGLNPITELPTTTTTPSFKVTPKDVYDPVAVPFTVTTTFADAANLYTGFLQTASAQKTVTVNQRRQQVVLVIDRSGSMVLENRFDNAKAACRVLVHLFAGLREGVNAGDRIGIVAFEDENFGFRAGGPSSRIQAILPLSSVPDAVAAIDDPAFDFGAPGTNTPIGDGLVFAIDMLAAQGPITDQNFNIVLVSDGLENSGHVALDSTLATGGAISFATAIGSLFPSRKAVAETSRFHINGIALGPTANPSQMNLLANQFKGVFAHVNNAFELASTFAGILQSAQDVNQVTEQLTPTTGVADPDAASFPAGANALYLTTDDEVDRLVVSVLPPAGSTVITDTIQLARWDGASYLPVTATVLATESDRSVSVSKLPDIANGQSLHWRVIHGTGPSTAHPLDLSQALCYIDLHLLADVVLDKPRYGTGDRMTLTVRIRQDFRPVLGSTIRAELTAPGVGIGEALSAIGDVPDDNRESVGKDTLTWLERRINALLGKRNWRHLPTTQPTGLFVDGTDQLFDPEGDGNYTNTFARVFKEGTYAWELFVDGQTVTGNPYTRTLAISTFATVKVSPRKTTIKVTRVHNHPSKMLAARIVVTPQDARGERLGPGHDANVVWSLKDGVFEDIFDKVPPPVFADGTYQRVILYGPRQRPEVVVKAAKVTLPTIDVRRALLGFDHGDDGDHGDHGDNGDSGAGKTTSVDGS